MAIDLDAASRSPASVFGRPSDVVSHPDLTHRQKLKILRQWETDARALSVAEEEGMTGGEPNMLQRVLLALEQLGGSPGERRGAATKHGN